MFTGYIENIVTLDNLTKKGNMNLLKLKLQKNMPDVKIGESISLNGVCLTVKYAEKNILTFEITEETLSRANIGSIKKTGLINMERAMKAGDRFNGHIVYGHIDGTRKIQSTNFYGKNKYIDVGMSKKDMFFLVNKGSIAIDGISLTIGNILKIKYAFF